MAKAIFMGRASMGRVGQVWYPPLEGVRWKGVIERKRAGLRGKPGPQIFHQPDRIDDRIERQRLEPVLAVEVLPLDHLRLLSVQAA